MRPALASDAQAPAQQAPEVKGERLRVWAGTATLMVLSPLTAIPWMLLTVLLLLVGDLVSGNQPELVTGASGIVKLVLGRTVIFVLVTIDVIARYALLSVPVFLTVAYLTARWAARNQSFWRRILLGMFYYGALYPLVFILAGRFDAFEGPFYN